MHFSDRPSVNSVLKKPFIQKRIQLFLSEEVRQFLTEDIEIYCGCLFCSLGVILLLVFSYHKVMVVKSGDSLLNLRLCIYYGNCRLELTISMK